MKKVFFSILALVLSFLVTGNVSAQASDEEKPVVNFKFGGFAKADYIITQSNYGAMSFRDFHVPSTISVDPDKEVYLYNDFHVKESRFNFDVSRDFKGKPLRAYIEMDFMLSGQGDERVSNSYSPRLRHFYLQYDKLLFGQTWSTFMIVIIPDDLDFTGAAEGIVFVRQAQVRLTLGTWQFALENPFVTYNGYLDPAGRYTSSSSFLPDVIVRKNFKADWGDMSIAAIGRQLSYWGANQTTGDRELKNGLGTGATVGGKIKIGSADDFRFVGTVGSGLGRYLGLNFVNSSVMNSAGDLKPIFTINGFVAYKHSWTSKLRTSVNGSYLFANNDNTLISGNANNRAFSASVNFLVEPTKGFILGVEPMFAMRSTVDGTYGDMYRMQFSAIYHFKFATSSK